MATTTKPKAPNFGRPNLASSSKPRTRGALASSIRGTGARQPSGLSKHSYSVLDDLSDDDGDEDVAPPVTRSGTYAMDFDDSEEDEIEMNDSHAQVEEDEDQYEDGEQEAEVDAEESDDEGSEDAQMEEEDDDYDIEEELLQEIAAEASGDPFGVDSMDIALPAATERMQREADDIFRASAMRSLSGPRREFNFASVAKDLYEQMGYATISEPADVIIPTEEVVSRLFDEGVGAEDDEERLDNSLAKAAEQLVDVIWEPYSASLPKNNQEHEAKVGPGLNEPDFEKAAWVAAMVFRIHHTAPLRDQFGGSRIVPLPLVLFKWQDDYHDPSRDQIDSIRTHRPCPAAHSLFWQGVYMSLIRGNLDAAASLLRNADWERVKKGTRAEQAYSGHVLANINRVVADVCSVMEICPGMRDESWDIRSSDWTLFRIKAKAAKENLINFAEGKDRPHRPTTRLQVSEFANSGTSLTGLARKAESRLPWDIYEALQSLYSILIGEADAITAAAQDWCEATVGLFGWWDDGHNSRKLGMTLSQSQSIAAQSAGDDDWLDRLALSFRAAMDSDFHFNTIDPVEVAIACAFESNVEGIIGFLRAWSLPIASAVAEIASLGRWLPASENDLIDMDQFDKEDLDVFGFTQSAGAADKDGIKDATLIRYARGLNEVKQFSGRVAKKSGATTSVTREGWELAVQVVGRMDDAGRSEELVNELLQSILDKLEPESQATVNKMWALLNDLGMINFAEDTAEVRRSNQASSLFN